MSAAKTSKYQVKETEGTIEILDSKGEMLYSFREPTGRDLMKLEKYTAAVNELSDVETMAYLAGILSVQELGANDFLDLPVRAFKAISKALNDFFLSQGN